MKIFCNLVPCTLFVKLCLWHGAIAPWSVAVNWHWLRKEQKQTKNM